MSDFPALYDCTNRTLHPLRNAAPFTVGRSQDVELPVLDINCSRKQFRIVYVSGRFYVEHLSANSPTYCNGRRITARTAINAGDRIDIGPYSLVFTGTALLPQTREDNVELIARGLRRVVTDRTTGRKRTLLDDVTLVIRPHEFVCLLGPSGAGKSTLLSALSARVPAEEGTVLLNGKDLYGNFESLKQDMVVVPQ